MFIALLTTLSFLLAALIPVYPEFTAPILKIQLLIYVLIIAKDLLTRRRLTLLHTWLCAYIFIIWSDMMLIATNDNITPYIYPILFYTLANSLVITGYFAYKPKSKRIHTNTYQAANTGLLLITILLCEVAYLYINYETVVETLIFGRTLTETLGSASIISVLTPALGMILPAIIAYYFRHIKRTNILIPILIVLPIFIYQFIIATRFQLLFQVLPFCIILDIVKVQNINWKSITLIIFFAIALSAFSSYTKQNRNFAKNEKEYVETKYSTDKTSDTFEAIALELSPEGIIDMIRMLDDYYEHNDHEYGKESAYILYFWVPRSIWTDKPTPIDHWLIRQYETVSDEYSASTGFVGFLKADFGWFALIFAIVWGIIIKRCDEFIKRTIENGNYSFTYVIATILYPYFFFAVRSPLTATQQLIFIFFIYIIFRRLFFNEYTTNHAKASTNKLNS